jgi:ankyrin repeat protein
VFSNFIAKDDEYAHQLNQEHRTCLTYAVQNNSYKITEFLVNMGVNLDHHDSNGATPLMYAIANNSYTIVQLLLRNGASPWSTPSIRMRDLL